VLVLCERAPWPREDRTALRNYWLIDGLAKKYAIDLVVTGEAGAMPSTFASIIDDYACFPAAAPNSPYANERARQAAVREHVANRLGRFPYVAIQAELPMAFALPRRDVIPLVYSTHYHQSSILSRMPAAHAMANEPVELVRALRLRMQERVMIGRSALVIAGSDAHAGRFERAVPGVRSRMAVVRDGVSVLDFSPLRAVPAPQRTILVTGSEAQRPNVAGVRWFLARVLPRMALGRNSGAIRVTGGDELRELKRRYPEVPFVPQSAAAAPLAQATIVAVPVLENGDGRAFILEASAAGRPVVTTEAGAAGLDYVANVDFAVADEPATFATTLDTMLSRPDVCSALAESAARRAQTHDWTRVGEEMRSVYERFGSEAVKPRVPTISGETVLSGRT
jgi:polysaccharide biosynthesis protein PslH